MTAASETYSQCPEQPRVVQIAAAGKVIGNVRNRDLIGRSILKRSDARVSCRVEQVNEEHVGIAVPVRDVVKRKRCTCDGLACQINAADAPSVSLMMIQIELVRPAAALV